MALWQHQQYRREKTRRIPMGYTIITVSLGFKIYKPTIFLYEELNKAPTINLSHKRAATRCTTQQKPYSITMQ
jgi:hypothetical protein